MRRHTVLELSIAVLMTFTLVSGVSAKEFVGVSITSVPSDIQPGAATTIGLRVVTDGDQPAAFASFIVTFTSSAGGAVTATAVPTSRPGLYEVTAALPAEGLWSLSFRMPDGLQPVAEGFIRVMPIAAAPAANDRAGEGAPADVSSARAPSDAMQTAWIVLAAVAAIALGAMLTLRASRRRRSRQVSVRTT